MVHACVRGGGGGQEAPTRHRQSLMPRAPANAASQLCEDGGACLHHAHALLHQCLHFAFIRPGLQLCELRLHTDQALKQQPQLGTKRGGG